MGRGVGPRTRGGRIWADGGRLARPGDLWPWGQGAPTGPGLIIHSVLQVMGLEHAARSAVQWAFALFFAHCRWERDTGRLLGSGSGQLSRSPYLHLISESLGPEVRLEARGVGSQERDTGSWPGSGSGQLSRSP